MTERRRAIPLLWAGLCLVVVAIFGVLVTADRSPLDGLDRIGQTGEDWADDHALLVDALRVVEVSFATVGMIILTTIVVVLLLLRRHRRAALFAVVTMVTTSLVTTGLKVWLGRGRPDWQDATNLLTTKSFPSGHASSIAAFTGILIVLVDDLHPALEHAPRGDRRLRGAVGGRLAWTGCSSAGTSPPTSSRGRCWASG